MTQVGDPLHTENHMTNFIRTGNRAANQLRPVRITRHYTCLLYTSDAADE